MREPAVEDVGPAHAVAQRVRAGLELRDHPLPRLAVGEQPLEAGEVGARDERRLVGPLGVHAGDIGQVDELLRADRLGDRARDGVRVDVVGLPVLVDADRGDDRDEFLADEPLEDGGLDARDVADETERGVALGDGDESGVLARQADRVRALPVDRRDHLAVHLADEGHPHDVDGLGVGDPTAVDERGLLAEPVHEVGDLRAAPVHDDRVDPDEAHEDDVLREQFGEFGRLHRVAAVLHDDGATGELADVRERVGEDGGPFLGGGGALVGHEVPRFSSMYA